MRLFRASPRFARLIVLLSLALPASALAQRLQEPHRCIYPEQRRVRYRCPEGICRLPDPTAAPPRTVVNPDCEGEELYLSLDQAITVALSNAEVIRVLAGVTAVSTGQTVYDPAMLNDSARN